MKKLCLLFLVAVISCVEAPPLIDYGIPSVSELYSNSQDLESSKIPSPDGLNVMIDDFSGTNCSNCPIETQAAKSLTKEFPGRIFVTVHYPESPNTLTYQVDGYENLKTWEAQYIAENIAQYENVLPALMLNRRVHPGYDKRNLQSVDTLIWKSLAESLLSETSIVNLSANLDKTSDSTIELHSEIIFQQSPAEDVFISVSILENNLIQPQSGSQGKIENYNHSHVLRTMFTQPSGDFLSSSDDIGRGTKLDKGWALKIPNHINQANAEIVITLNYNSAESHEVIQCLKLDLN